MNMAIVADAKGEKNSCIQDSSGLHKEVVFQGH